MPRHNPLTEVQTRRCQRQRGEVPVAHPTACVGRGLKPIPLHGLGLLSLRLAPGLRVGCRLIPSGPSRGDTTNEEDWNKFNEAEEADTKCIFLISHNHGYTILLYCPQNAK